MKGNIALLYLTVDEFVIEKDYKGKEKKAAALKEVQNTKANVFVTKCLITGQNDIHLA